MGGQAQDNAETPEAGDQDDRPMVQGAPPLAGRGATPGTGAQTAGPLCVLWNHRKRASTVAVSPRDGTQLAAVAQPPGPAEVHAVGPLSPTASRLPATTGTSRPLGVPSSSESVIRGAGCGNSARPDLRGARRPDPRNRLHGHEGGNARNRQGGSYRSKAGALSRPHFVGSVSVGPRVPMFATGSMI
jgi:hypothetical protein